MTDRLLKQQLLGLVDDIYIWNLRSDIFGYAKVSMMDFLKHLYNNYSDITPEKQHENDRHMKSKWNFSLPFATFVAQIEGAQDFAEAAGTPHTDAQIIDIAYQVIYKTGVFNDACRRWRAKAAGQKN